MKEYSKLDFTRDVYKDWKIPTADQVPEINLVREKEQATQKKEPKIENK